MATSEREDEVEEFCYTTEEILEDGKGDTNSIIMGDWSGVGDESYSNIVGHMDWSGVVGDESYSNIVGHMDWSGVVGDESYSNIVGPYGLEWCCWR